MKLFICIFFLCCLFSLQVLAVGENCSSPIAVTAGCPAVKMTNQSSAGMGNDINIWKYSTYYSYTLNGEDMVYEITFSPGTTSILVSLTNVNQYCYLFTSSDCAINPATVYPITYIGSGDTHNLSITAPTVGNKLYLYLDHIGSSNLTFDIAFGSVKQGTYVSIPDTRGKLEFVKTNCFSPTYLPDLDLYRNGTKLISPASFGNINEQQEFCFKFFVQNLTGKEGVKSFRFTFNSTGFSHLNVTSTSIPGKYAPGTWDANINANVVTWTFTHATDPGKGDYDDVTKNCMEYDFCINATINSLTQLSMNFWVTGDGRSPGYNGYQYSGCCATPNACTAYGAIGYGTTLSGAAAGAAGFGFGIGPGGLPVDLLEVWLAQQNTLHWKTTNEKNLAYYVVQYAADGKQFEDIQKIAAVGNEQNGLNNYQTNLDDFQLQPGYLRIRCVDEDGAEKFSEIISYHLSQTAALDVLLSPNPVQSLLHIQSTEDMQSVNIYDLNGTPIYSKSASTDEHLKEVDYDFINQPKGIYTLQIITSQGIVHKRVVKE